MSAQAVAAGDVSARQEDMQRMVAAAVAMQVEEAEMKVAVAQRQLDEVS